MLVNEIFKSFQSEGIFVGQPAIFLRLSGCNINCDFCDTEYDNYEKYDIKELVDVIVYNCRSNNIDLLIITGGEPSLQKNEIKDLIQLLPKDIRIQIETNGYDYMYLNDDVTYMISPKKDMEKTFKQYYDKKNCYFKFLVKDEHSLDEIEELINKYNYDKIYWLQPLFSRDKEVCNLILNNIHRFKNANLSVQIHKYIYIR